MTEINSLEIARYLMKQAVPPGGNAVDATMGLGRDTLFLAKLVGPEGKVWSFDLQQEALRQTEQLLTEDGVAERVKLIHSGHEQLERYVAEPVNGIMFNLGYLPGGDKKIITRPTSTLQALEVGLERITPEGIITLVLYTGHPGGQEEAEAVENLLGGLSQRLYNVVKFTYPNRGVTTPYLIAVQKGSGGFKA